MDDSEEIAHYVNRSLSRSLTDQLTLKENIEEEGSLGGSVQIPERDIREYELLGGYFSSLCSRIADFFGYREEPLSEEGRFYRFVDNKLDMEEFKDYTD